MRMMLTQGLGDHRLKCLYIFLLTACNNGAGETESEAGTNNTTEPTMTSVVPTTAATVDMTSAGPGTASETDSTSSPSETDSTAATTDDPCPEGTVLCIDGEALTCDGNGGYSEEETCDGFCLEGVGCVACEPGSQRCEGEYSEVCLDDGSAYEMVEHCDPIQGMTCEDGVCQGVCALNSLDQTHLGCSFYPTQTAGLRSENWPFTFGVAVVNVSDAAADIRVENAGAILSEFSLDPGSVQEVDLPDIPELVNGFAESEPSVLVAKGAYRLRSNQPVVVVQYNPNGAVKEGTSSFVNDSTLLPPWHTLTDAYRVVSRNHWVSQDQRSGFYVVTALHDQTEVTLTPSATGIAVLAGGGVAADGTGVVTLDAEDVLAVYTDTLGGLPDQSDLTGTLVSATHPVQVIGGHKCTYVPVDVAACERLEEVVPPLATAGTEHVVVPPLVPTGANNPKVQMVRVVATAVDTHLSYEPAIDGAPTEIAEPGDYIDFGPLNTDFVITSDAPVLVSQYMVGQNGGNNTGDPAMLITVPSAQYQDGYQIHASPGFMNNYVSVVAPSGAVVELDGVELMESTEIGTSGYKVARTPLQPKPDGLYTLTSDAAFTVNVYGYSQHSTYWHSGGQRFEHLDL